MKIEAIIAGHGGQGVLELANYISYFHLLKGRHVAYTPSYGPETRGGKVKCYVVGSDGLIDSPIVEEPDLLVVMNIPSMDFVPMLKTGGTLLINSSLVAQPPDRSDIRSVMVPATEIASGLKELGPPGGKDTVIVANSVMFGAYLALTEGSPEKEMGTIREVFEHFLTERKAAYIPLNLRAVERGYEHVKENGDRVWASKEMPA
ncbi:MAG: 2-oxoacid:acceptor oxidoreductase family protein [Thaumarchaeota archaeon]|nr:2-oxoacid:acceptor oxidoreductase family protein [Nitrososphaerota archaeon]